MSEGSGKPRCGDCCYWTPYGSVWKKSNPKPHGYCMRSEAAFDDDTPSNAFGIEDGTYANIAVGPDFGCVLHKAEP